MWEDYLEQATASIANKYHRRRAQAKIRQQLLSIWAELTHTGMESPRAMVEAMEMLGDPRHLAEKLATPLRQQRGWLWLVSFAQLMAGLGLLLVSFRTASLADMAVGRVLTLWGFATTGFNTYHHKELWANLKIALRNWRLSLTWVTWGQKARIIAVSAISGILAAVLCSLPWEFVPNTVFHPVMVSDFLGLSSFALAAWGPYYVFRRSIAMAFRDITWQIWAALTSTVTYTTLVVVNGQFVPPPFFNWQPELFILGSFVSFFAALRVYAFFLALKERIEPWSDDEIRPAI
ncbi:hypothetical protein [Sulfobacillus thermosulfidooxidans]|uniref:hypothetical protein n=1 Tax=Sulfobacillus thermosulfidooxidans TaxID=28034 RepID=UPI00096B786C|nr:hypothetical protein [Sulfobacillus thermosulfidooxidans]OLZ11653.1 hypothetical protein BFX05_06540 [Sulfobacillus thermosulfidooxidans]OLZ18616.1 hypothetical protein BFX06_00135 [Sulfobacillus thermosulfidooxidans]OLZ20305.1 hypothetical protein BFX07_01665 [Sulfobacillus thermosulfidooxidans]